jgi:hypothetical protein
MEYQKDYEPMSLPPPARHPPEIVRTSAFFIRTFPKSFGQFKQGVGYICYFTSLKGVTTDCISIDNGRNYNSFRKEVLEELIGENL